MALLSSNAGYDRGLLVVQELSIPRTVHSKKRPSLLDAIQSFRPDTHSAIGPVQEGLITLILRLASDSGLSLGLNLASDSDLSLGLRVASDWTQD